MNHDDRQAVFDILRKEEDRLMFTKGKEYSQRSMDVNRNFKIVADLLADAPMDDLTVASVYALKHVLSICDYVAHRPTELTESIEGRINDVRNYFGILWSLIVEQRREDERTVEHLSDAT